MKKLTKPGRPSKTVRIYYGAHPASGDRLYWTLRVRNATQAVAINGALIDAIKGKPGVTVGCHLSHCAMRNASEFPHPCKLAAFTRSTALIVTRINKGTPDRCIRYRHGYGQFVDLNDRQFTKVLADHHPEFVARRFELFPPQVKRNTITTRPSRKNRVQDGSKRPVVPRGALARAQKAGLVSLGLTSLLKAA